MTSDTVQLSSWRLGLRRIESFVGLLFCWGVGLLTFFLPITFWLTLVLSKQSPIAIRVIGGLLTLLPMLILQRANFAMFASTWQAQYRDRPLGIEAAELMPRWSWMLRPIVALWWLLHFAAGALAAFMLETTIYDVPAVTRNGRPDPAGAEFLIIAFAFGLTFAGNTFLLLAIAAFKNDNRLLTRVWGWRFAIDAIVSGGPAIIAWYHLHH